MKLLRKIILMALTVLFLLVSGLGAFAWLRHDQLASAVIEKLNKAVNTKITYGTLKVSIFESFPNITVRFNDLLIAPSRKYDRLQFTKESNDTLLYASTVSLAVDLRSLISGTIAIRSITAKAGMLNLLTDDKGNINYEVYSPNERGGGKSVRLNSITVVNIKTVWFDKESNLRIAGNIEESSLSGEILSSGIYLNTSLSASLSSVDLSGMNLTDIPAKATIRLRKTNNSLSITRGSLELAGLEFGVDGTVNYSSKYIDMSITGRKINISDLVAHLPGNWKRVTGALNPDGMIDLNCILIGPYGKDISPHYEITYNLSQGRLNYPSTGLNVSNLAFRGSMTNGNLNKPESFFFAVDTLTTSFGSAYFTGSFRLSNLTNPVIALSLRGDLIFEDIKKVIKTDLINRQEGSIKGSVKLSGSLPDSMKFSFAGLPSLNPDALLSFKDFGATFGSKGLTLSGVSGDVEISDALVADSLAFSYLGQRFVVSLKMQNFIVWLAGKPENT